VQIHTPPPPIQVAPPRLPPPQPRPGLAALVVQPPARRRHQLAAIAAGDRQQALTPQDGSMHPDLSTCGKMLLAVFPPGSDPPSIADKPTVSPATTPAVTHRIALLPTFYPRGRGCLANPLARRIVSERTLAARDRAGARARGQ